MNNWKRINTKNESLVEKKIRSVGEYFRFFVLVKETGPHSKRWQKI